MKIVSFILLGLIGLSFNGCGDMEMNSIWRRQHIIIDGDDSDWSKTLVKSDKVNALLGIENDSDYLYICLSTDDPEVKNVILRQGLTLWYKTSENGSDNFGIRFPIGLTDSALAAEEGISNPRRRSASISQSEDRMLNNQTEMEIINTNGDRIKIPISELKDIQLKVVLNDGKLIYETKIPLSQKNSTTYALNANEGSTIRVGIISGPGKRTGFNPLNRNPDMPSGNGQDPGGYYGGRQGINDFPAMGNRSDMFMLKPVNFWINIKLASDK
jgi:hypothetical protein